MNALGLGGTDDIDAWLSNDGWYGIIAASHLYLLTCICCKQLAHERIIVVSANGMEESHYLVNQQNDTTLVVIMQSPQAFWS